MNIARWVKLSAVTVAFALALAGCGGDDTFSCKTTALHFCYQFTASGLSSSDETSLKNSCTAMGTWANGACASGSVLGSCTLPSGVTEFTGSANVKDVKVFYYQGEGFDAATAEMACQVMSGTWHAG